MSISPWAKSRDTFLSLLKRGPPIGKQILVFTEALRPLKGARVSTNARRFARLKSLRLKGFCKEITNRFDILLCFAEYLLLYLTFTRYPGRRGRGWMVEDKAPARRRRLGAHGMMFRRRRIFAQLREGFTYDEIAAEEGVSTRASARSSRKSCSSARSTAGPSMRSCNWIAWLPRCSSRPRHRRRRYFRDQSLSQGARPARPLSDRSPAPTRSMTTKRARSSWTRSTASPRTSASTRTSKPRCRST